MHGSAHPLLSLYLDSFFSLPLNRADGQHLSYQDVVRELDQDTLWRSIGTIGEGVALSMKVSIYRIPIVLLSPTSFRTGRKEQVPRRRRLDSRSTLLLRLRRRQVSVIFPPSF